MPLPRASAGALIAVLLLAACGGSQPRSTPSRPGPQSIVSKVCRRTFEGARRVLGPSVRVRVALSDPADIECVAGAGGMTADMEAQASPRAWTQFDTTVVHLVQAFGSGSVHEPAHLPHPVKGVAQQAVWVPAQGELVATNGTQSAGGTYLTVTISGRGSSGPRGLDLAVAVARAVVPVAPKGPSPGPPPN